MQNEKNHLRLAIIGGSGLYELDGLKILEEKHIDTPFGKPSDAFLIGEMDGVQIAFLPRHGRGHRILPSELNFRANIYAIKKLACSKVVSVSAVGSLREEIAPGHFVMVDQFIDRCKHRIDTFFGEGVVGHVAFAHPVCPSLRALLAQKSQSLGLTTHEKGTYVCIEGPMFSTQAESRLYRQWGADVVGMTNLQEAKLAREAGLCYATVALSTDYDCWHPDHDAVSTEMVIATLQQNVSNAKKLLQAIIPIFGSASPQLQACTCASAAAHAVMTQKICIPSETQQKLALLFGEF